MPDLLIASENPGKLVEIQAILEGLPVRLVSPRDLGLRLDVAETGQTYAENAALKARAYARAGQMVALGDDSGLEVAALDNRPGLYSHRFSPKPDATDADRRAYLLELLAGKPFPDGLAGWPAAFHCTVAVATPAGEVRFAEGTCPGLIIPDERGTGGFGYDPIFLLPEYGKTMAELDMDAKNRVSHRGRAVQAAEPILRELFRL
jgi:XTP/dITP diphosphohydrolase